MDRLNIYLNKFNLEPAGIETVPESYSSEVFFLRTHCGTPVILKIPYSHIKLEREYQVLRMLADSLPVPKILNYWEGSGDIPGALLLSFINGRPVEGYVNPSLAYQLGELLAKVHSIDMPLFHLEKRTFTDWWEGIELAFSRYLAECEQILDKDEIERYSLLFTKFKKTSPPADGPCLVHMDFRPGNILIRDNRIQGLIDFESSRGGSADVDFTKMKLYVWDRYENSRQHFLAGYKTIRPVPAIERSLPFYLFYNALGGVAWCIRRGQLNSPFFRENREQLTWAYRGLRDTL
ncbi:MAG: aminoglycoside phosphotransferase family protein [Halanaerobium sp.]|nr:aminoglycoside phosphotransferase family protein [Halanaerobium sp.]